MNFRSWPLRLRLNDKSSYESSPKSHRGTGDFQKHWWRALVESVSAGNGQAKRRTQNQLVSGELGIVLELALAESPGSKAFAQSSEFVGSFEIVETPRYLLL